MTAAEEIAKALHARKLSTGGWIAKCPAHDDHSPSLSINEADDGKPLVHCHAGCDGAVIRALQDRGLWPEHDNGELPLAHGQLGRYLQHWDYHDAAGKHVMRVCRWETSTGKTIRPLTLQDGRWQWKSFERDRPLYRLTVLLENKSKRVIISEGEKTADAVQKLFPEMIATTWSGGAKAFNKTYMVPLANRDVTLVADFDEPGRQAMDALTMILQKLGCTVRRADLSPLGSLPKGWDVADALGDRTFDLDALSQAIEGASTATEIAPADDKEQPESAQPRIQLLGFSADELLAPITPERNLLPGLPTEAYTLIAGALSSFKSTLLHYLGLWRATGFDLLNLDPDGAGCDIGPTLLLVYEDSDRRFKARTQRIVQHAHAGITAAHGKRSASDFLARIEKNFRRVVLTGQVGATLVCRGPKGIIQPNQSLIDELLTAARAFTASNLLIGIDPLRLAITGSQNDDDGADIVVHVLNNLAMTLPDSGIVICSHTTKSGALEQQADGYAAAAYGTSGSALYSQHARSNFLIARIRADKARELLDVGDIDDALESQPIARLTHGRLSHGGESPDRYFRNISGALVPVGKRESRTAADRIELAAPIIAAAIDRLIQQGVRVSMKAILAADDCKRRLGPVRDAKEIIGLMEENGYIEFTGSTKDRTGRLTTKGQRFLESNRTESSSTP